MDTSVEAPAAATHLAPFQVGLDFEMSVKTWADSAIAILETTTEERQRIAVRDEAVRVGAFPISRSRAHTHRRHGHPLQTVPSAGLIERPQEKNRVDALR